MPEHQQRLHIVLSVHTIKHKRRAQDKRHGNGDDGCQTARKIVRVLLVPFYVNRGEEHKHQRKDHQILEERLDVVFLVVRQRPPCQLSESIDIELYHTLITYSV